MPKKKYSTNKQFQVVMDGLDSLVYVTDMDTYEVLFINKYGRDILGDIVGRTCWQILQSGQSGPCPFCTNHRLLDEGGKPTGVYKWEFQSTIDQQWYECQDQAIPWNDGQLVRLEIATKITKRKQAEDELQWSNERYKAIFNTAGRSIILVEKNGEIVDINPYHVTHIGKGLTVRGDYLGENILTRPSVVNAGLVKAYQSVLEGAMVEKENVHFPKTTGGVEGYFNVRGVPLLKDGEVVGAIFSHDDVTERVSVEEKLRQQATTDPLTGIFNRRHFFNLAENELKRSKRYGHPLSVIIFDIDHFKRVNDTYGHTVGDQALCKLTNETQAGLREIDIFARYGGEEFIIMLPDTGLEQAHMMAERIRRRCAGTTPLEVGQATVSTTVSFGVASREDEDISLDDLILRADTALYSSKKAGRNRVTVWRPS